MTQAANHILLIKPSRFAFNAETAGSNAFQKEKTDAPVNVSDLAMKEFDFFAQRLRDNGVNVLVFDDTLSPHKPDAIFPNNWVSFHPDGTVILYPMFAANRRLERRPDIINSLRKQFGIKNIVDLSHYEKENKFLEGTGSVVFDHVNKIAYACLSPRTDKGLFIELCSILNYEPVWFYAHDKNGKEIYHTNVMMCLGEKFAVICLQSISDEVERKRVEQLLVSTGHEIIDIDFTQMNQFAGNMLCVADKDKQCNLVMSQSAYDSLRPDQIKSLEKYSAIINVPIPVIETVGGGSARCMMAEVFLPRL